MRRITHVIEFRKGKEPKEVKKNEDEEEQGSQCTLDEWH